MLVFYTHNGLERMSGLDLAVLREHGFPLPVTPFLQFRSQNDPRVDALVGRAACEKSWKVPIFPTL